MASHRGELYVTTVFRGGLYRVDLDTLTGTQIGADNFGLIHETYPFAIASHGSPDELYMVGSANDALYTVDVDTGAATRIGTSTEFGVEESEPAGLTSHNGDLYMTGTDTAPALHAGHRHRGRHPGRHQHRVRRGGVACARHSDRLQPTRRLHARQHHGGDRLHRAPQLRPEFTYCTCRQATAGTQPTWPTPPSTTSPG